MCHTFQQSVPSSLPVRHNVGQLALPLTLPSARGVVHLLTVHTPLPWVVLGEMLWSRRVCNRGMNCSMSGGSACPLLAVVVTNEGLGQFQAKFFQPGLLHL